MNKNSNDKTTLSTNTLFHFTDNIDKLESILINELYPNYSLENWDNIAGGTFEIGIPMVCFCDIPLSQINNHARNYGKYTLGLTKEWGMKNNICPVLYTFNAASTTSYIMDLFTQYELSGVNNPHSKALDQAIVKLSLFMKPYVVKLKIQNKERYDVRFYDEREWRYAPNINKENEKIKLFLNPDEFNDTRLKDQETDKLKSKKVSFEPNDIKYIIVESENEILDMFHKIQNIKGNKYSLDDVMKLQTRIISMEHIRDDF